MFKISTLLSVLIASQVVYAEINRIVAYADSLTDNGNTHRYSGYPPAPYYEGRFSNGPTWIDYTAKSLGIPQINNAFGGATSNNDYVYSKYNDYIVPGFKQQLEQLPPPYGSQEQNLYAVFMGANDIMGLAHAYTYVMVRNYTITTIVDNVMKGIERMYTIYKARNFIVFNQFPLDRLPVIKPKNKPYVKDVINQFNSELFKRVDAMKSSNITHVDVHTWLSGVLDNPTMYDFKITNSSCLDALKVCKKPDEYLVWDAVHPTTKLHKLLGRHVATIVSKNFNIHN
ncbi:hypothetical protein K7432_016154 [Basidiobolus ranarum]|uniref:Uncharacterized protein n=1 Tax=Basidiobolus ranarum TaxID=34480 RepID=A0ABR2WF53_9FUNG